VLKTGDVIEVGQTVLRFDDAERAPEERTRVEVAKEPAPPRKATPAEPQPARPVPQPALVADPMTAPRAAEPPLQLVPESAPPPAAVEPGRKRVTLEVVLMSAGIALTLLGVGVAALML
jgi:pyruvate/2-oxoglutarate dehydrogenase complex dihydrolipoamide acyltransferase (E2) component